MQRIRIFGSLESDQDVVKIPDGKFTLYMMASGSGEVTIDYSVSEEACVRFVTGKSSVRMVQGKDTLSAKPKIISKTVQICRRKKEKKNDFRITATVKKIDGKGNVPDSKWRRCKIGFLARENADTCTE